MIRSMVIWAGGVDQSLSYLYHPSILCQTYFYRGGYKARSVSIQEDCLYLAPQAVEDYLFACGVPALGYYCVYEPPRGLQDPSVTFCLLCLRFGHCLADLHKKLILTCWCFRGTEGGRSVQQLKNCDFPLRVVLGRQPRTM